MNYIEKEFNWQEKTFEEYMKEQIAIRLDDLEDNEIYPCDLAFKLFEGENTDGSLHYNTYEDTKFIQKYWNEAKNTYNYLKKELDMEFNSFEEPEKMAVCMALKGAEDLINQSQYVREKWNDRVVLEKNIIDRIKEELSITAKDQAYEK